MMLQQMFGQGGMQVPGGQGGASGGAPPQGPQTGPSFETQGMPQGVGLPMPQGGGFTPAPDTGDNIGVPAPPTGDDQFAQMPPGGNQGGTVGSGASPMAQQLAQIPPEARQRLIQALMQRMQGGGM